jgi:NitT/TauT family transport system permease protein
MSTEPINASTIARRPETTAKAPAGEPGLGASVAAKAGFVVFLLLLWQAWSWWGTGHDFLRPGPVEVGRAWGELVADGTLVRALAASLRRIAVGYAISIVAGFTIGVLLARNWLVKNTLGGLVLALQSLPSVCWLPFALLWVGLNEGAILAVVILGATFAIAISTEGAIRNIPPLYVKVGRNLGAKRWTLTRDILFFAALPELIGGLKVGWTFAWRSLMAAELIRQDVVGVARLLDTGRQFNDLPLMLASILTILAVGLVVDLGVFGRLERVVRRRWGLER